MIFKKKAQIAGQIFIFILAIFLASLILLYGYKAIFGKQGFIYKTEQISLIRFETEISNAIRTISSDYASVKKLELNVPSKFTEVCLIDTRQPAENTGICTRNNPDFNPIICDAWTTQGNKQNVFLVPMAEIPITVSTLEIETGYICLPVKQGKITLRLEGLGDRTKVSEWILQ